MYDPRPGFTAPPQQTRTAIHLAARDLARRVMGQWGVTSVEVDGDRIGVWSTTPDPARLMTPGSWGGFDVDVHRARAAQSSGLPHTFEMVVDHTGAVQVNPRRGVPVLREMTSGEVPTVLTTITPAQALGYLQAVAPSSLTPEGLRLIGAQSSFETAHWKAMHNWNFGNVTPSSGSQDWMTQGVPNMRYLSFSDGLAGAKAMMDWLSRHGALGPAMQGDLAGYMQALQNGCYLGCIGNIDPSNGLEITQSSYDTYGSGLAAIAQELQSVTPEPPTFFGRHPVLKTLAGITALVGLAAGSGYVATRV